MHLLEPQNSSCIRAHVGRKFVSEQPGHDAKEEEAASSQAFRASLDAVDGLRSCLRSKQAFARTTPDTSMAHGPLSSV